MFTNHYSNFVALSQKLVITFDPFGGGVETRPAAGKKGAPEGAPEPVDILWITMWITFRQKGSPPVESDPPSDGAITPLAGVIASPWRG